MIVAVEAVTPVTQAVTFAVVGGFFAVLTLILNNRNKAQSEARADRQQAAIALALREGKEIDRAAAIAKEQRDYARQDLVADRLDRATNVTITKLNQVEDLGKVTHALVNSDKTAELKRQLDDKFVTLALMREVMSLRKEAGREPTADTLGAIASLEANMVTLRQAIDDRLQQQATAEAQVKIDRSPVHAPLPLPPPKPPAPLAEPDESS